MGFWHTGYMEFHETTGLGEDWRREPKPPEYPCPDCELVFSTERDQRAHRFDGHASKRPTLVLRGRECGRTRLRVSSPTLASDWNFAEDSTIVVNGQRLSVEDARAFLSETKFGVHSVTVENGSLGRTFEFDFCLADDEDLQLVDMALEKLISSQELSRLSIDHFIMRAGRGQTARRYREGLANYLYGVLAREDSTDLTSSEALGSGGYEERYNRAVHELGSFDRPAAEAVCGLVAFHYNHFDLAIRKTNSHRVSDVAARFKAMVAGSGFVKSSLIDRTHSSMDAALSDSVTEVMLSLSAMALDGSERDGILSHVPEISTLRPEDQLKVRLIASESLLAYGDVEGARHHSEALRNYKDTDAWYAGFRARMHEVER